MNTNDAGAGSLRNALTTAGNGDTIKFNIGDGVQTISPATPLPTISVPITIDGTAPGAHPTQIIELNGSGAGAGAVGLQVVSGGGGTTIEALVIGGFSGEAIELNANGNTITGNFIGTDTTGATALANGKGIFSNSSNNIIGGTAIPALAAGAGNLISGNTGDGIFIQGASGTGNTIEGNYIGTVLAGTSALANSTNGVEIQSASNTVGGTAVGTGNVISGNTGDGILITGAAATGTLIKGNFIGTDKNGTAAVANHGTAGVEINGAGTSTVGGTTIAARNVISGNSGSGVDIHNAGATSNLIEGNYIGIDKNGANTVANVGDGITILGGATNNTVGGTASGAGNVLAGNTGNGINISGTGTTGNMVEGNTIGINAAAMPVGKANAIGVLIQSAAANNIIGGTVSGASNTISGNTGAGVQISDPNTTGNQVQGNVIGANAVGSSAVANANGVVIRNGAANNIIGGSASGAGNLISGNTGAGVQITGANTTGNLVEGNSIGLNQAGSGALANANGVVIQSSASNNTIGGTASGAGNTISDNSGAGVQVSDVNTTGNIIEGNKIGTDAVGMSAQPNANGVVIRNSATNNTIGGTAPGATNLISGNTSAGILITDSGTSSNLVQGNTIGLNSTATPTALPNGTGVSIAGGASNNTIGGTATGAADVISGNTSGAGVLITDANTTGNTVAGNFIGTLADGSTGRANTNGVVIQNGAANNTIGGATATAGNTISGNSASGIKITGSGTTGNLGENNFIGTTASGTAALANATGITIQAGASGNTIGGGAAGTGNLISGNTGDGVLITGANSNIIQANFLGTNAAGTAALANMNGIDIQGGASNNTIGGTSSTAGNLISGNTAAGLLISGVGTSANLIEGNFIGTNGTGQGALANHDGVMIQSMATNNTVGGSSSGSGNLISGNTASGITITGTGTTGNQVLNNAIGVDSAGTAKLGNQTGVSVQGGATSNTIGSATAALGNVISGNSGDGVQFTGGGTSNNQVVGNFIGTNAAGGTPLANSVGVAIRAGATNNTIGGNVSGAGNLISGNTTQGVLIVGPGVSGNLVQGNFIGTDTGGTKSLPNLTGGVALQGGATGNTVGGTTAGVSNVISGNQGDGVFIFGAGTNGNFVQGNFIGTQNDGTTPLPNTGDGVSLTAGAANNTVGGSILTGGGNIIGFNGLTGIFVQSAGNTNFSGANFNSNSTDIDSGTLQLTTGNAIPTTSAVIINTNGMLDLNGHSDTIPSLSDGPGGGGNILLGNRALTVGDGNNTTFSGSISGANGTMVKTGAGTLTLKGTNTYLGTVINMGTLLVDGIHMGPTPTTTATEAVLAGTTLGGGGTAGFTTVNGTVSPGDNGSGILTVQGALFKTGSNLAIELKNNTLGTGYDQLAGTGASISLGAGVATLTVTELPGFTSTVGDVFDIVHNPAGVTGTFNGLADNATIAINGTIFRINYTLMDVTLTHVAASTTTMLITSGSPSTIGFTVTFTATVSVISPGTGTPTGMVTFKDGNATLGSSSLTNGQASFSTSSLTIGQHMITAVYGGSTDFGSSTSNVVIQDVIAGQADHFTVTAPTTVQAGAPFSFTVTARDSMGNVATTFTDQVNVTSIDSTAVIVTTPYTFTTGPGADNGVHTFTITLKSAGPQSVTVTDTVTSSVTASANVKVVSKFPKDIIGRASSTGQWWVGLSNGSTVFNTTLWTTWSAAVQWTDVVTGDFVGDGRTDIAGRDPNTGAWWVGVSNGSTFTTSLWTAWSTSVTWVDVKVGDFNGDGKMDIVGRVLQTGQWWVAQSTGSSFTNSLWDTWSPLVTWVDVQVGDFNGDGKSDITGRVLSNGGWWTGLSTGSSFNTTLWATWSTGVTWVDVQVGDFNGDGKADIAGRAKETGQWWVGLSDGSTAFNTGLWTTWSTGVTWVDVKVGDFNGDGKADIVGRALEIGQWWVAQSTGSSFVNKLWDTWSTSMTWVDVQIGDFNGDGKTDITGRAKETGQWQTALSNGSAFTSTIWTTWSTGVTWLDVRSGNFA